VKKYIAVTIGDIRGIGIHLLINEWQNRKINNFILLTNNKIFLKYFSNIIKKYQINLINNINRDKFDKTKFNIFNIKAYNENQNTFESLKKSYEMTKDNLFKGIVTLPINKNKINKLNANFLDQTNFFSNLDNKKFSNMVFVYNKKFFTPLTTHIELRKVYKKFKDKKTIISKIINFNKMLINDFNINKPKILIAGINPHCGENGLISNDDKKFLNPVIYDLKKLNINITGPISGDSIINKNNLSKFDGFIFAYHDQALIPFKLISNLRGINYTSNLDIIRVSPSHGTAKELVKTKLANSKSLLSCFKYVNEIYKNRRKFC
tara:strand:+ start:7963 stop:8925 length:963 start_codon:yes stop_codon:yes gene_type:complete